MARTPWSVSARKEFLAANAHAGNIERGKTYAHARPQKVGGQEETGIMTRTQRMTRRRSGVLALCLAPVAMSLLLNGPASAFACYVGESPDGVVLLRERPDDKARIVAQLSEFNMVSDAPAVRERNGWIHVRWSKTQLSQKDFARGKGDGKGWMKREHIRGECED